MTNQSHCSGLCGRVVTEAGQFCSGCDVPQTEDAKLCIGCGEPHGTFGCVDAADGCLESVPGQTLAERESNHLRQRVLHHAYELAMGNKAERKDALEELSKLVAILNQ